MYEKRNAAVGLIHHRIIHFAGEASSLRPQVGMEKCRVSIVTIVILAVLFITPRWHHPAPAAAVVEAAAGTVSKADQAALNEIVASFDRAESAVQQQELDVLMDFYAKAYNYHGLKWSDVRRVWSEVFTHYGQLTSKHVFTGLKLVRDDGFKKAYVTCTGGLYGIEKRTGKPITIDSWVQEVHYLVKEKGGWKFLGNAGGTSLSAPPASAPHHPLF